MMDRMLFAVVVVSSIAGSWCEVSGEAVIDVHADRAAHPVSRYFTGACIEDVNHEVYGGIYSQMVFGESFQEPPDAGAADAVSRMWGPVRQGSADGRFEINSDHPFTGTQCQQVTYSGGTGAIGIEDRGLNHWGMSFAADKPYEGHLWVRCAHPTTLFVAAQSADGSKGYAEAKLIAKPGDWRRIEFTLTPAGTDPNGRFAILLKEPGSVALGHVFLQPGEWGRFKGLPVRKDVADGLIAEGLTVLRYGGSMINAPEYRWKKMIGPRDRRPPYKGTWYPYSSNGWGIIDFLSFCEAAGFLAVPDLNLDEAPQDVADFIEYVNGPPDSSWGRRRVEDGHPASFALKYVELGNEEAVDDAYWHKFKPMAEAIWSKDATVTPVVGDFAYGRHIADPFNFKGAPRISSLAAHQKILNFAAEQKKPVWFDVHVGNDSPGDPLPQIEVLGEYIDWLGKLSPKAEFKVCVFEENANNHTYRRALAHARTIDALMGLSDHVPIVCAANCLQCEGQNDNGWDQGLLFLSPSKVWAQPSYFVTRMISRNYLPRRVESEARGPGGVLDVATCENEGGSVLTVQVTNVGDEPESTTLQLHGFGPARIVESIELAANLNEVNTSQRPDRIIPHDRQPRQRFEGGTTHYTFPPRSFTVLRVERGQ